MVDLKYNIIEFGVSIVVLAVFIIVFALAEDVAGAWSSLVYVVAILAFTIAFCLLGWKLAPLMYDHFS